jgi:hypothetical protein
MTRLRQKGAVLDLIAEVMLKHKKVLSKQEYIGLGQVPVRYGQIQNFFGSWERMINFMRKSRPDVFEAVKPKPAPPPVKPAPTPSPAPKAAPAPKPAPAVKKDEK